MTGVTSAGEVGLTYWRQRDKNVPHKARLVIHIDQPQAEAGNWFPGARTKMASGAHHLRV